MVRVEHIYRRTVATGAGLITRTVVITNIVKRVAVGNLVVFYSLKRRVEIFSRHRKRVMLITFRSPRSKLQGEIFADSDHGERAVLTFILETENISVEIYAGRKVV